MTADTSHDPIGPLGPEEQCPTGDSVMHEPTASRSSALLWGANTAVLFVVVTRGANAVVLFAVATTVTTKAFGVGALADDAQNNVHTLFVSRASYVMATNHGEKSTKRTEQRTKIIKNPCP